MILTSTNCPFCDKRFCIDGGLGFEIPEELRIHIIEHHHITEKKYHELMSALKLKRSMNEICIDMKDVIQEFAEKLVTFEKNEANDFFGNEVAWSNEDSKLREREWRKQ